MGEVAAVRETHGQHGVSGLEGRKVDSLVGRGARVRLHVGVLGAVERFRPLDRQGLHLVDDLTAAVVTVARQTLRILVRKDAAHRLEHRNSREVLRGYELYVLALTGKFLLDKLAYGGIDLRQR